MATKAVLQQQLKEARAEIDALRKQLAEMRVMGAFEAAECLGISVHNLDHRLRGLPEPHQTIRATRVWLALDMETFAGEYRERREARAQRINNHEGET